MNFLYDKQHIEKLLNSVKINPDKKLAVALAKKDCVSYVHNTAALEGNPMTFPEVQTLLEGITIGGHKLSDEQQILNQNESWEKLIQIVEDNNFNTDKEIFCNLQAIVAKEEAIEWGKFRSAEVNIGGTEFKPPKADQLEEIFQENIEEINHIENPLQKALVFFLFSAVNQFFFDGNKRSSRLMMNGILLENGWNILNIKATNRLEFNKQMIVFYDSQDATKILEYLIEYYKKQ